MFHAPFQHAPGALSSWPIGSDSPVRARLRVEVLARRHPGVALERGVERRLGAKPGVHGHLQDIARRRGMHRGGEHVRWSLHGGVCTGQGRLAVHRAARDVSLERLSVLSLRMRRTAVWRALWLASGLGLASCSREGRPGEGRETTGRLMDKKEKVFR